MNEVLRRKAEETFQQAADLPPEERSFFLDQHCGSDPALRREAELLLNCFEKPTVPVLRDVDQLDEAEATLVGERIGSYEIRELLGEGGFGSVYLADQIEPVRRQVALKIIKPGMDSRQVLVRFEAERQALATMDHPHIAKVLDAGTTDTGRPYFAMELVRGVPISKYCEDQGLTTRQRLDLFVLVCRAVQHAHQKGIIHRDIKPSNVLVTLLDGIPVPKIIDFGVAKAMNEPLTDRAAVTRIQQFIGTPEYVSPEQAELSEQGIDTRADVYSLGVLLYELLTGTTPFDRHGLRNASYAEVLRTIREELPVTPSRRLTSLASASGSDAPRRQTVTDASRRLVRGDLDWITMRALEKDRARRYESAAALAADIEHHLHHEPVSAGPPGATYRLRKLVARHKAASIFLATLFLSVTGFGIWMGVLYSESDQLRMRAEQERGLAEANLMRALDAEERAETEAAFLRDLLTSVEPSRALGREVTVRYVLDQAAARIDEGWLEGQPEARAAVQLTIGGTYRSLGLYQSSEYHLRAADDAFQSLLGPEHPETLRARYALGVLARSAGDLPRAEAILRPVVEAQTRILGSDHPDTLNSVSALGVSLWRPGGYAEAEWLHRETLAIRRRVLGCENRATLKSLSNLGAVLQAQEQYAEGEEVLRESLETALRVLDEGHPLTAGIMNNLGLLLRAQGRYAEAEDLFRVSLSLNRRVLSRGHPKTRIPAHNLMGVLLAQEKWEELRTHTVEQISYEKEAAEREDASVGELHRYAWTLLTCEPADLRNPEAALPLAESAADLTRRQNPDILDTLALAYFMTGKTDLAVSTQREAVAMASPGRSVDPPGLRQRLIDYLCDRGDYLEAAFAHRAFVSEDLGTPKTGDTDLANSLFESGRTLVEHGDYVRAEPILRMSLAVHEQTPQPESSEFIETLRMLGATLSVQGKFEEAERLLLRCYSLAESIDDPECERARDAVKSIVNLYEVWDKPVQAGEWRRKLRIEDGE